MERLDKLINILKLTPHRQPELVKEATNRILNRSFRFEPKIHNDHLKHILEVLLKYCDSDDGAQRSLFNDYLNSVILAFQGHCYQKILNVLITEVNNNGSTRTVTAALLRIPLLIDNVRPIELGYDPQKLLKSLIEISRRAEDESVQKALHATLDQVVPYLDYHIRQSKESLFLTNTLVDSLLRNLSCPTKRSAVACLKSIYTHSQHHQPVILSKLKILLDFFKAQDAGIPLDAGKFSGLCLAIKEFHDFSEQYGPDIFASLFGQILEGDRDSVITVYVLEAARETLQRSSFDDNPIEYGFVEALVDKFLIHTDDQGEIKIRTDSKVILQTNALALISAIVQREPNILRSKSTNDDLRLSATNVHRHTQLLDRLLLFKDHLDVAVRNQVYYLLGTYMDSCWKFPLKAEHSLNCEQVRSLWCEFRKALNDDTTHPDVLKSCLISMNICINTLLQSDHCMHIVEYEDFERLMHLYNETSFKPLRVEVLNFFAQLDYLTLSCLELHHWSYYRSRLSSSFASCIQQRLMTDIIVRSLTDESQMIRSAASSTLLSIIPKLHIMSDSQRSCDPIVSLASELAGQQSVIFEQANDQSDLASDNISTTNLRPDEEMVIRKESKILSSSIIREKFHDDQTNTNNHSKRVESANLKRVVNILRFALENSLEKGKVAVLSIVRTLLKLSKAYPIYQYPSSWDCRPSEHCECFILLHFLLTYLENMTEPDVVIEDLDAYQTFLAMSTDLLYALCHESVFFEYENQRMKPYYRRLVGAKDSAWSDLAIKYLPIASTLQVYFTHLVKLLWLLAYVVEEKSNPFAMTSKSQQHQMMQDTTVGTNHSTLISNRLFFGKMHRKLESSYRSSKKNLKKQDEKFQLMVETCLSGLSSLNEFMSTNQSKEYVRDILSYLKVLSAVNNIATLTCARQLLKSLFGVNIIALYQVDPLDWFEEEDASNVEQSSEKESSQERMNPSLHGVYHHLVFNPYKIFSGYLSNNCSQITPGSDRALASLDFESRRVMRVRYRVEENIKSLFEFYPQQLVLPKIKEVSEMLKCTIAEFTPIVMECMKQFNYGCFCHYQAEVLHFMSYLILLRVNYQKLPLAEDFINSIYKLLDSCGERRFLAREKDIDQVLRNCFTFLTLLTYERGPSKPMFQVATVIQKLDDIRAKLSSSNAEDKDVTTYVIPLLRCLIEDLFIYRTEYFHQSFLPKDEGVIVNGDSVSVEKSSIKAFNNLEAERETVAQKLMDIIENPGAYDLLSILILESRLNSDGTKYEKLSQRLFSLLPEMCCERKLDIANHKRLELTKRILENISTEVFKPVTFIIQTLLETPIPAPDGDIQSFQRWMSLVVINIHILTTQVKEEKFLTRIDETMSESAFIKYLFQIIQLCASEIFLSHSKTGTRSFLVQQLAYYIHYITYMFQSGLFFHLSKNAPGFITTKNQSSTGLPRKFKDLCRWARVNEFSLTACETIFFYLRYSHPDLTIMWCNLMMLLNNVDCNSDFWCNLLIYDCYHCQMPKSAEYEGVSVINSGDSSSSFKRGRHVNRPSSLNLLDISFNDQLRRSFIKKIATSESRPKTFEKNDVDATVEGSANDEEFEKFGQCLSPNVELSRRGALCLVLDYVSISMNDVEHITWLIIHHINDIIRWSHEMPIAEFINAVHGNSASSGIFIQAIDTNVNDLTSFSFVTRLLWSLEKVHYTQYGSLVVLLVEKILSSREIMPYRALTKNVEKFACDAVRNLLNDTNKSLVTTNEEIINQLTSEDLDRIIGMLDSDLYHDLTQLLIELRNSSQDSVVTPTVEFCRINDESDDEPEIENEVELLYSRANLIHWHAEQGYTAHMSTLLMAINTLKSLLSRDEIIERVERDETLVCFLVSSIYTLVMTVLPPPTRLSRPRIWSHVDANQSNLPKMEFDFSNAKTICKPVMPIGSRRSTVKSETGKKKLGPPNKTNRTKSELIEEVRLACLEGLFLFDSIDCLKIEQFGCVNELIIRLARLSLINSFVLTPPDLWKRNIWPTSFHDNDDYKVAFPLAPYEILSKDYGLLKDFCDRILKLGWICRRQFEEISMTLLGLLSTSLSQPEPNSFSDPCVNESKIDLCKLVITTLTRFLGLTRKQAIGDPLSGDVYSTQSFDERVINLVESVRTNLSSLKEKTRDIFQSIDSDLKTPTRAPNASGKLSSNGHPDSMKMFNHNLKIAAHRLRMSSILNIATDVQDGTSSNQTQKDRSSRSDEVDIESCIRLILSIYKQKLREPFEEAQDDQLTQLERERHQKARKTKGQSNQLPPPLVTSIILSILSLSDMFTDYEQFLWMFEAFMHMFKVAERNEDEIQMQYLIIGLCKSATICCYELPKDLITLTSTGNYSHELMFEKCRQSIERCLRSDLLTLKQNALHGAFYMLEDSINIVASGAWELDDFEKLRQSRWIWIHCLVPAILQSDLSKTSIPNQRSKTLNLLEVLCSAVVEFGVVAVKESVNRRGSNFQINLSK